MFLLRWQQTKRSLMLEKNGVLHALQMLIENAIGKAKHLLKANKIQVPISAYDAFSKRVKLGHLPAGELAEWHLIIGLRSMVYRDYRSSNDATLMIYDDLIGFSNLGVYIEVTL